MKTEILTNDYHCSITANVNAKEAFDRINNVTGWWAKNFEGQSQKTGDVFTVRFGETFVTFKITEAIGNKKIVWQVTDCYIPKLSDKTEWNGTSVVWEISSDKNSTTVDMTHIGLVPGIECFAMCENGWNRHVKGSLLNLLTENKGQPS